MTDESVFLKINMEPESIRESWDLSDTYDVTLVFPWGFSLWREVKCTFYDVGIKTAAPSSGKPVLRKYISVKFTVSSWILVHFIIQQYLN